jgi:hypothetical protein
MSKRFMTGRLQNEPSDRLPWTLRPSSKNGQPESIQLGLDFRMGRCRLTTS